MSLYLRGAVYWSRIEFEGVLYQRSTKARNKNVARGIEAKFRTDLAKGKAGLLSPTVSSFSTKFINSLPGRVAKATFTFYVHNWTMIAESSLGEVRLDRIDAAVLEEFTQELRRKHPPLEPSTINATLRTLRKGLHLAVDWNVIAKAPKVRLLPNENQRDYVLSADTVEAFTKEPRPIRWLVPFMVDTGLRRSEAVALTWDDVNFSERSILVRKGKTKNSRRRIPLTKKAEAVLKELPRVEKCNSVFTRNDRPITNGWASHAFLRARIRLGLPDEAVLHSCRHTFCTNLGAAGADAFSIQRLAGHSSIVISQRYVHTAASKLDAAIALLD